MPSNADMTKGEPEVVADLYSGVDRVLGLVGPDGRRAGDCQFGVYLFKDYDGEPIYVGQTAERLRVRIRRHLTNQRTDAVAMNVLDPFEVDEVVMWPLWDVAEAVGARSMSGAEAKTVLDCAEYTVYRDAVEKSEFGVILNEAPVTATSIIDLPGSVTGKILPEAVRAVRNHPDVRLARRARTIANLAGVISERSVRPGIRHTFLAQAQRLESLARARLEGLGELGEDVQAAGLFDSSDEG